MSGFAAFAIVWTTATVGVMVIVGLGYAIDRWRARVWRNVTERRINALKPLTNSRREYPLRWR